MEVRWNVVDRQGNPILPGDRVEVAVIAGRCQKRIEFRRGKVTKITLRPNDLSIQLLLDRNERGWQELRTYHKLKNMLKLPLV